MLFWQIVLFCYLIYFIHIVLVIMDVSYGRYQIVITLKSFVLLGGRA